MFYKEIALYHEGHHHDHDHVHTDYIISTLG